VLDDKLLEFASRNLEQLDDAQKAQVLHLLEEREKLSKYADAREHFLPFVKHVWPNFIQGGHHVIMGEAFERVAQGKTKRLAISIGPRHGKSELTSYMLPAWFFGKFPDKKIIQVSNSERLAAGFGRKVRNMLGSDDKYHEIFPGTVLALDSQAAADWHTSKAGRYFAVGINGQVTGEGSDIAILDDIHSEQQAKQAESNPAVFDDAVEWYTSGIRQRLQPGGAIIIVMTRWSKRDLIGQVLKRMKDDLASGAKKGTFDEWEVIEFPAILDEDTPSERPLWPGFWTLDELQATKKAIGPVKWAAQYLQAPTGGSNAIFKSTNWRVWGDAKEQCPMPEYEFAWADGSPPPCDFLIHSWDTAIKKTERADYSAFTSWGVFKVDVPIGEDDLEADAPPAFRQRRFRTINHAILLSSYKARLEFPELKRKVKEFYDEDKPDTLLIEDKGSGSSLIQELRSMGVPVENFSYGRGGAKGTGTSNDKIARANLITDIFASGFVWRPDNRSSEMVVAEMSDFPAGEHDDLVDSTVQAMIRFRNGGLIRTQHDEEEEQSLSRFRRRRMY
jgi:predicted phage terminase large subunit-like protein